MEIFPSDQIKLAISPTARADEVAAIMTAISTYLEDDRSLELAPVPRLHRWARAGRLEAQRIPVTEATLHGRWRLTT